MEIDGNVDQIDLLSATKDLPQIEEEEEDN